MDEFPIYRVYIHRRWCRISPFNSSLGSWISGWWFLAYFFYVHPDLGEMIQFDVHIFQTGWNKQLVRKDFCDVSYLNPPVGMLKCWASRDLFQKQIFFSLKQPEGLGGCFLKWWYPQQPWVFLLEIIILGWFWGYHHLRKHPGSHHFFAIFSIFPRHQTTQNRRTGHSNSRERRGKTLLSRRSWRIKRSPQFQGVSRAMNWTAKLVCQDNRARTRISTARQCVGLVKAKIGCSEKEEQIHWVEFK